MMAGAAKPMAGHCAIGFPVAPEFIKRIFGIEMQVRGAQTGHQGGQRFGCLSKPRYLYDMQRDAQRREGFGQSQDTAANKRELALTMPMVSPLCFGNQETPGHLPRCSCGMQGRIVSNPQITAKPDQVFQKRCTGYWSVWIRVPRDASS